MAAPPLQSERDFLSNKLSRRLRFRCTWAIVVLPCLALLSLTFTPSVFSSWPLTHIRPHFESPASTTSEATPPTTITHRTLLSNHTEDEFPNALSSGKEWQMVFYIIGILYMFLALAIVCDEFFVPALMVLCSKDYLNLSDDVAGATFMAAGGSAPELFTSFIGTFRKSDVGFGTIIGSAVFNVLFVIGMCAVFSLEPLNLTWWPLFRDCSYYAMSLIFVFIFFGHVTPREIHPWESCILLSLYVGYILVMKNHRKVYVALMHARHGPSWTVKEDEFCNVQFVNPSTFRAGIVKLLTSDKGLEETAGIFAVCQLKGDLNHIFNELDSNCDGMLDSEELKVLLKKMNPAHEPDQQDVEDMIANIKKKEPRPRQSSLLVIRRRSSQSSESPGPSMVRNATNSTAKEAGSFRGEVSYDEFAHWYATSEKRIHDEMEKTWHYFDANGDGKIDEHELQRCLSLMSSLSHIPTRSDMNSTVAEVMREIDLDGDGQISKDEFMVWYRRSMFWQRAQELHETEEEVSEPISLEFPDEDAPLRAKLFWFITAPILFVLLITLPDVSRTDSLCGIQYRRYAIVTFFLSICWIGVFSFFMVDWTVIVGDTLTIPEAVMGLTFIAAGTSVPDLLSSVIVAKQGKGDMAVSSSIGSNIFDVLIGLPLPWLSFSIYHGTTVKVKADSLEFSLLVLVLMIFFVVLTVHINRWVMTKRLGYTMFFLYVIFLIQDLVFNFYCDDKFGSYLDGCKE